LVNSSKLNIDAQFNECLGTTALIRSVQMSFDGLSVCEQYVPFALFGNSRDGLVSYGRVLQLGNHTVTAIPHTGSKCNGAVGGAVLSRTFQVSGCGLSFNVYNGRNESLSAPLVNGGTVTKPPCQVNIQASVSCGFSVSKVLIELRKGKSVIKSSTEATAPYFLFGNNGADVYSGTISAGTYVIQATIDGIIHPPVSFTFSGACVP
jgi:hypothetical protein